MAPVLSHEVGKSHEPVTTHKSRDWLSSSENMSMVENIPIHRGIASQKNNFTPFLL